MFKSEAQAYQYIRRHWKVLRDHNQRKSSIHQWEAIHGEKHPQTKKLLVERKLTDDAYMTVDIRDSEYAAKLCRGHISSYQNLLNGYMVEQNDI